jgi:DNA-binding XRE family transcriptional regulator
LPALIPALPFCHSELRAVRPKSDRYPKEINTLGDHIRSRRLDLNLLQMQVAEQIGVDEITITNWERKPTYED